jgi:hypothetical protein
VVSLINVLCDVRIDLLVKALGSLLLFLDLGLVSHALGCHLSDLGGVRGTPLFKGLSTPFKFLLDVLGHLRLCQ